MNRAGGEDLSLALLLLLMTISFKPRPSAPLQVSRHLSKLFDSLCKLKFQLDANEKPLKVGLGMYSKEDEYVDFDQDCDLSGQVSPARLPAGPRSAPGTAARWAAPGCPGC